jgi:hypothetical protein
MKKFVALYYAPASAMGKMANVSPKEQSKEMAPWMAWKSKNENNIVDFGAPLMPGLSVDASGDWGKSSTEVTGFSILEGASTEEVKALFTDHPHLSWSEGCSIEVHEFAAI